MFGKPNDILSSLASSLRRRQIKPLTLYSHKTKIAIALPSAFGEACFPDQLPASTNRHKTSSGNLVGSFPMAYLTEVTGLSTIILFLSSVFKGGRQTKKLKRRDFIGLKDFPRKN